MCLERLSEESLFSLKKKKKTRQLGWGCKVASEQTTEVLEQCSLDRCDLNGDVWPWSTAPHLEKTKHVIATVTHGDARVMI